MFKRFCERESIFGRAQKCIFTIPELLGRTTWLHVNCDLWNEFKHCIFIIMGSGKHKSTVSLLATWQGGTILSVHLDKSFSKSLQTKALGTYLNFTSTSYRGHQRWKIDVNKSLLMPLSGGSKCNKLASFLKYFQNYHSLFLKCHENAV